MKYPGLMFLVLVVTSALGQSAPSTQPPSSLDSPTTMITVLYRKVVIYHPFSLLEGKSMRTFSAYLSKALLHKIQSAQACSREKPRSGHYLLG
jgi:hypothetical protein